MEVNYNFLEYLWVRELQPIDSQLAALLEVTSQHTRVVTKFSSEELGKIVLWQDGIWMKMYKN